MTMDQMGQQVTWVMGQYLIIGPQPVRGPMTRRCCRFCAAADTAIGNLVLLTKN